ncbi:unnamed protein product [Rotaria sordida]|uniref:Phospholipid scramblase n=1 Tax=Rotaria sordida TaxID=392033 RepID=A0A819KHZ0_9BILA|nr:unnamed protein product [Rotaria sordida]
MSQVRQQPISWSSELIRVHRQLQSSGLYYCGSDKNCMQQVTVECPPGRIIGTLLGTDRTTEIGSIDKLYPNSMQISSANPVAFTLNFPMNLDTNMKILVLGALFLIDIGNYKMVRLR